MKRPSGFRIAEGPKVGFRQTSRQMVRAAAAAGGLRTRRERKARNRFAHLRDRYRAPVPRAVAEAMSAREASTNAKRQRLQAARAA